VPLASSAAAQRLTSPDAADQALEAVSTQAAMALIASLPHDQAEIIMLRVVVGLDASDVARIVGKTPGAVRVAAHRGLRQLAGQAERAGVTH
jgi:RNA polymerase sigma-70 factor, ECF subfamily